MNGIKVDVTKEAQDQVRELIKRQQAGTGVRVYLNSGGGGCGCGSGGGGCGCGGGGSRFGMAFDRERPGDEVVQVDGFSLFVDEMSAEMLDGAEIDYVQSLEQTGFRVTAPKLGAGGHEAPHGEAGGGCGCGSGGCGCG